MPDIVLSTLNAKYIHAAFGLRYLMANLGPLQPRACLAEFDINQQRPIDIAEALLARQPQVVGLGVYIWNAGPSTELVGLLKKIRPELVIVLGGPEVSFETSEQTIVRLADYVITGEGDLEFQRLCERLLAGDRPPEKMINAPLPAFADIKLPYALYTEQDLAHRVTYVEASRGCPFSCEFCLSSLDIPVRQVPLNDFLVQLGDLLDRGARQLKFVDRTFNLNLEVSRTILQFLLKRYQPGHLFHFEMVPDRFPETLRALITRFPPGVVQFEVGVQTFNPEVADRISRRQYYDRLEQNLSFLRRQTGVHLHADLIAGLPGEDLASFARGFDRLVALQPHEIQVGILKRLRGTPISRHDQEWSMLYNPQPPYDILQNRQLDFATLQRLRRFARYWDLVGNSGNFLETTPLLWTKPGPGLSDSPFHAFMRWSDWLHGRVGKTDSIALVRLMELLFQYLTTERALNPCSTAQTLWRDYHRTGRSDKPNFLKEFLPVGSGTSETGPASTGGAKRQARHRAQTH